jgi:P4 family phage/plasmid primase-like protien
MTTIRQNQNNDTHNLDNNQIDVLINDAKCLTKIFNSGDYNIIKHFHTLEKDNIKCISSDSNGLFFIYDNINLLWIESSIHNVITYYLKKMTCIINDHYNILNEMLLYPNITLSQKEKLDMVLKELGNIRKKYLKCSYANTMKSLFYSLFNDEEFFDKLNRTSNLLSINKKVIDLKNGNIRDRRKTDYFSIEINITENQYNDADIEIWDNFFKSIFVKEDKRKLITDNELVEYMRYYLGYCLTGECDLRSILCFYGDGSNGKSMFLELITKLLNTNNKNKFYSIFDKSTFLDIKKSNCDDVYYSKYSRVVICDEFNENDEINTSLIKKISSGDEISVSGKYKSKLSFSPIFKSILASNHMMKLPADDTAVFDRLIPVFFRRRFLPSHEINKSKFDNGYEALRDNNLKDKLLNNMAGLLKYLVIGSIEYYKLRNNKPKPQSIITFSNDYKEDCQSEPFYKWLDDEIEITNNNDDKIELTELMNNYNLYNRNPKYSLNRPNGFSKKLKSVDIETRRSSKLIDGKRPTIVYGVKYKVDVDGDSDSDDE